MRFNRIFAIILRFLFLFRRSFDRLSDSFYWPTIDLLLWGLTSAYFESHLPGASPVIMIVLSGILLWMVVWRGQYEISVNLLEELWNKNLINIFVSPLKFSEWVASLLILSVVKAFLSITFALLIAFLLYKIQIFTYGFYLIPFIALLLLTGWWMGFLVSGLILRFGLKVQNFAWTLIYVIAPFSAIYYPLSILPEWAQKIALIIPTSYVFEGMREVLTTHTLDPNKIYISLGLNIIYLILSIIFLKRSFDKLMNRGLLQIT